MGMKVSLIDWLLRLLKGALIGTGFILPGVSGGALAAVFGLYERIISFIAHLTKDFVKNVLFFIPVGIGALIGMVVLSRPLSFFLENYEAPALWFFIGAIIGTVPSLWRDAGKEGRKGRHLVIMAAAFIAGRAGLGLMGRLSGGALPQNLFTWFGSGAFIALGILVPGLSPSNFLVFMGMYKPMVDAFKNLDLAALLPLFAGAALCLILLSKAVDLLFRKAYAGLFHGVLGLVFASTVMIIPLNYNYLQAAALLCVLTLLAGAALGWWMSGLSSAADDQK
jgi:putative membrane protein